jgi:hypothetical protein
MTTPSASCCNRLNSVLRHERYNLREIDVQASLDEPRMKAENGDCGRKTATEAIHLGPTYDVCRLTFAIEVV